MTASAIERRKRDSKINKAIGRSNTKAAAAADSDDNSPAERDNSPAVSRRRGGSKAAEKVAGKTTWSQIGVTALIVAVIASSFVQIITNIWTQPSMSDAH